MTENSPNYWTLDSPDPESATHPEWVALVSETDGGIIAVGRRDVIEATAEALNAEPDDWHTP